MGLDFLTSNTAWIFCDMPWWKSIESSYLKWFYEKYTNSVQVQVSLLLLYQADFSLKLTKVFVREPYQ